MELEIVESNWQNIYPDFVSKRTYPTRDEANKLGSIHRPEPRKRSGVLRTDIWSDGNETTELEEV